MNVVARHTPAKKISEKILKSWRLFNITRRAINPEIQSLKRLIH